MNWGVEMPELNFEKQLFRFNVVFRCPGLWWGINIVQRLFNT